MVAAGESPVLMIMDGLGAPTQDKAEEQQEYVVVESDNP